MILLLRKNRSCCSPHNSPEAAEAVDAEHEPLGENQSPLPATVPNAHTSLRVRDRTLLGIAVAVPLLGLSMSVLSGGEQVCLGFDPGILLPQTCGSRWLLGIDCPGCGLTRSTVYLMHGHLAESLKMHRLGWPILLLIVSHIPYRVWCLSGNRARIPWSGLADRILWGGLIGLLYLNWMWTLLAAV